MAIKKKHRLLWAAGAGVAGFAAYKWVYQPWAAQRALLAAAGATNAGGFLPSYPTAPLPSPGTMLSPPTTVGGPTSIGQTYGGVLGACIAKKGGTWTPQYCQQRLDALVGAAQNAKAAIAQLKAGGTNPAAAGIPAAQAALAANQAALATATTNYNNSLAAGNSNDAAIWHAAILGHQADIVDLTNRIAAAKAPVNNLAAISAFEGQLASNDNDYFNLTGVHLISAV